MGVTRFGQAVLGPPGTGKTTYCQGVAAFLQEMGREVAVVNLDPANDSLPYEPEINIAELVNLADVMEEHGLGPNGGLVYCMEYIEQNVDWLMSKVEELGGKGRYLLFDFPGQVELYTHGDTVHRILRTLEKWGCRLTAVNLIDAHHCSDAGKFIAAALVSLVTMIRLELPHVNILSKLDLIESCGPLAFSLDFYTDALDLSGLLPLLGGRYQRLNEALCELIQDFSLVAFQTLNVQDAEALERVLAVVDKCNGYLLAGQELAASASGASARGGGRGPERALHLHERLAKLAFSAMLDHDRVKDVQDRYMEASREGAPIKEADESQ